jgi:hypothetical protein
MELYLVEEKIKSYRKTPCNPINSSTISLTKKY